MPHFCPHERVWPNLVLPKGRVGPEDSKLYISMISTLPRLSCPAAVLRAYGVVKKLFFLLAFLTVGGGLTAQADDAFVVRDVYRYALTEGECYDWLRHLCKDVGPRLAGSPGADGRASPRAGAGRDVCLGV